MAYQKSVYFVPVSFCNFKLFCNAFASSAMWDEISGEALCPRYLLSYAARIAKDSTLFRAFSLKKECFLPIYTFEKELPEIEAKITDIRFSCFSTEVGFLEFWVEYNGNTAEEIANFSYHFKKAAKMNGKALPEGMVSLYDAAKALLPAGYDSSVFFTSCALFKCECLTFHFIQLTETCESDIEADRRLALLKRSYNTSFTSSCESIYDMIYKPYENDHWGGSTEGIVNISYNPECGEKNFYLDNIKEDHLKIDYYFLYLLLLNQRFSAIRYIHEIAEGADTGKKEVEIINKKIVRLKTVFSFRVISDDLIFQNMYAKMYDILDIDRLLEDIRDNENQRELLQNIDTAKTEKRSSQFLMGISLLSLFSALIDASSYFDRISFLQPFATLLGAISTLAIILLCIFWLYTHRDNK